MNSKENTICVSSTTNWGDSESVSESEKSPKKSSKSLGFPGIKDPVSKFPDHVNNSHIINLNNKDLFADIGHRHQKVHIRIQIRNQRKCILSVSGLATDLDLKKICRYFKKTLKCNGVVKHDEKHGNIIQLQGDHREFVRKFLIVEEIIPKEFIVVHGF
jgi:translation initiation factor 1